MLDDLFYAVDNGAAYGCFAIAKILNAIDGKESISEEIRHEKLKIQRMGKLRNIIEDWDKRYVEKARMLEKIGDEIPQSEKNKKIKVYRKALNYAMKHRKMGEELLELEYSGLYWITILTPAWLMRWLSPQESWKEWSNVYELYQKIKECYIK